MSFHVANDANIDFVMVNLAYSHHTHVHKQNNKNLFYYHLSFDAFFKLIKVFCFQFVGKTVFGFFTILMLNEQKFLKIDFF